jgi:hypothetical protein
VRDAYEYKWTKRVLIISLCVMLLSIAAAVGSFLSGLYFSVGIIASVLIPLCGYCGSVLRLRWLIGCFVVANLAMAILFVVSVGLAIASRDLFVAGVPAGAYVAVGLGVVMAMLQCAGANAGTHLLTAKHRFVATSSVATAAAVTTVPVPVPLGAHYGATAAQQKEQQVEIVIIDDIPVIIAPVPVPAAPAPASKSSKAATRPHKRSTSDPFAAYERYPTPTYATGPPSGYAAGPPYPGYSSGYSSGYPPYSGYPQYGGQPPYGAGASYYSGGPIPVATAVSATDPRVQPAGVQPAAAAAAAASKASGWGATAPPRRPLRSASY